MKKWKRIVSLIATLTLVVSGFAFSTTHVNALTVGKNVELNPAGIVFGDYVGSKGGGTITKNTFTASVYNFGWEIIGGISGYAVHLEKNKKYNLSFSIKSTNIDKYIYVCVMEGPFRPNAKPIWYKWIDCKKGKNKKIKDSFKIKKTGDYFLRFCFGGEIGCSLYIDYSKAPNKTLDKRLGDKLYETKSKIVATNISLKENGALIVYVGQKVKLKVKGFKKPKWKSSNKKVVTVSKKGVLKAKRKGTATITARKGKKKKTIKVKVKASSVTIE